MGAQHDPHIGLGGRSSILYSCSAAANGGLAMRNVHMKQGDAVGSAFSAENGIWQDGGARVECLDVSASLAIYELTGSYLHGYFSIAGADNLGPM